MAKKVLVLGSGGREHAICDQFAKSKQVGKIYALPGNAGTHTIAENISSIRIDDHKKISEFCIQNKIDLVFVGPEQPLVSGIVDYLQKSQIPVFGPSKAASELEGSKVFMKRIASENAIPTADYQVFVDSVAASNFIKKSDRDVNVIKADGLAAGKGVVITHTKHEALQLIEEIFSGKFGSAGDQIIIEEFLDGIEVSYFVIADGKNFIPIGFAHDHKKLLDGDAGPNTGGMGSFAPSHLIDDDAERQDRR